MRNERIAMTTGAAHLFDVPSGGISLAGGVPDLSPIEMRGLSEQVGRQIRLGGPTILQYSTMETPSDLVEAIEEDERIAATGPLPSEDREGADELVYIDRGWSPKRATRKELSRPRLDAAFLLASGCLIRVRALREIGPMREDLFIDHVDLEWGVRARRAGWRLVAVPAARLNHSLGDEVVRLPGRAQPIHVHSPIRNYYIVRNTIALVKWNGFPVRWRIRYTYWAVKYAVFNSFMAGRGPERRRLIARGLRDGVLGRLGPIGSGT